MIQPHHALCLGYWANLRLIASLSFKLAPKAKWKVSVESSWHRHADHRGRGRWRIRAGWRTSIWLAWRAGFHYAVFGWHTYRENNLYDYSDFSCVRRPLKREKNVWIFLVTVARETHLKALWIISCMTWYVMISARVLTAVVPLVFADLTSMVLTVFTLQVWMIRFHILVCFWIFTERNCQEIEHRLTPTRRTIQAPPHLIST